MAGYSQFIWEDFADEIYALLRKCMSADASNSEAFLLEHFNNEEIQNQIITYLKVQHVNVSNLDLYLLALSDTHVGLDEDSFGRLCSLCASPLCSQLLRSQH